MCPNDHPATFEGGSPRVQHCQASRSERGADRAGGAELLLELLDEEVSVTNRGISRRAPAGALAGGRQSLLIRVAGGRRVAAATSRGRRPVAKVFVSFDRRLSDVATVIPFALSVEVDRAQASGGVPQYVSAEVEPFDSRQFARIVDSRRTTTDGPHRRNDRAVRAPADTEARRAPG